MSKLSHSSLQRYQTCPTSYKLHYIDRIVNKYKSGALYFGSAIDEALNCLLSAEQRHLAKQKFNEKWEKQLDNSKTLIDISKDENVVYSNSDFDKDLLTQEDLNEIEKFIEITMPTDEHPLDLYAGLKDKKTIRNLTSKETQFFNYMNWLCLKRKGHLMLDYYEKSIIPNIKEVICIQKNIEYTTETGETLTAYIDVIVKWKDGSIVIIDNKTSSIDYELDSVKKSQQLALYLTLANKELGLNITKAGFIVLKKGIKKDIEKVCKICKFKAEKGSTHKTCHNMIKLKRCNGEWDRKVEFRVDSQIIIDEIPGQTLEFMLNNVNEIGRAIKTEIWPKNLSSCKQPWGYCEYYNKCWHQSDKDLIKRPKE